MYGGGCDRRYSLSSNNRKTVGSIPGSSGPRIGMSMGKILNPKLLLIAAPMVYECECD